MSNQATEAAIAAVANKATGIGGGLAIYGGWTTNDFAAVGGFLIAVIGICVQVYYKRKADRRDAAAEVREKIEHALRLERLRRRDE